MLALYQVSDVVHRESGILAAAVAGLVVGNAHRARVSRELREFKDQLTVLLIGLLFVLLAADVRIADIAALGWPGIATVLVLILVIRPLAVLASTAVSDPSWRERAFIAWLAPRGIVAAAVATVFARRLAEAGFAEDRSFRALVFLVIAVTVVVQGLSGGLVASALGVRRRTNEGWAIIGANVLGRALARALGLTGEEVVLIESDARHVAAAAREELRVVYGDANDERVLRRADVPGRRGLLAVTPVEGTNLLLADRARRLGVPQRFVALDRVQKAVDPERAAELGAHVLFGAPIDLGAWIGILERGEARIRPWRYRGEEELPGAALLPTDARTGVVPAALPLALVRGHLAEPFDEQTVIAPGDAVVIAVRKAEPGAPLPRPGEWSRVPPGRVRTDARP